MKTVKEDLYRLILRTIMLDTTQTQVEITMEVQILVTHKHYLQNLFIQGKTMGCREPVSNFLTNQVMTKPAYAIYADKKGSDRTADLQSDQQFYSLPRLSN